MMAMKPGTVERVTKLLGTLTQ